MLLKEDVAAKPGVICVWILLLFVFVLVLHCNFGIQRVGWFCDSIVHAEVIRYTAMTSHLCVEIVLLIKSFVQPHKLSPSLSKLWWEAQR